MIFVIYIFCICIWGMLMGMVGEIIIWKNPLFHCFKAEAEIIELLDFSMSKKHFYITVVNYKKYNMTQKTFVYSSKKDRVGDIIEIATNGDVSVRTKFYWRKDNAAFGILIVILGLCLSSWHLLQNYKIINLKLLLIGLLIIIIELFFHFVLYSITYNDVKNKIHII